MHTDEELESGYGPATPDGDNLLNDFARGERTAFAQWGRARGDRVVEDAELALTMVDAASGNPFGNPSVLGRPLLGAELDAAVDRMRGFYAEQAGGPYIILNAWPTPDLRGAGLHLVGHPPFMFRPAGPLTVPPIAGLEIRPVVDATGAADFEDVFVAGYPVPELQPMQRGSFMPPEALAAKDWHHWVGYLDGRPVATASTFLGPHHQHVEFVSALPDTRGRGIGGAITAAATLVDPTLPAALIASDDGQPVYRRLGYRSLLRYTLWLGTRRLDVAQRSEIRRRTRLRAGSRPPRAVRRARPRLLPCGPT